MVSFFLNFKIIYIPEQGSKEFNEFLSFLGNRVELAGWKGFAGGLDTSGSMFSLVHYNISNPIRKYDWKGNYLYEMEKNGIYFPCLHAFTRFCC